MVRVILVLVAAMVTTVLMAAPEVLIDTDFGVPGKAFSDVNAGNGNSITGFLPQGWSENSGWKSKVVAEYKPVTEGGRSFLRIAQKSGDGLQFTHALSGIEKTAGYYRLTFTARSATGASLAVRHVGPPYATIWPLDPVLDAQWRDFSYDFRLDPQQQELGLYVYPSGNGTLDLQKLRVVKLAEEDLIEEIRAKYPEAGSGNLVRLTRFPLGLQSGWAIDRDYSDGDQVHVDSDPKVAGPSGISALRLNAPAGIRVYSAPFGVPWSFEPHVASLHVRGDWDGKLVAAGGREQVCHAVQLNLGGAERQAVQITFNPCLPA